MKAIAKKDFFVGEDKVFNTGHEFVVRELRASGIVVMTRRGEQAFVFDSEHVEVIKKDYELMFKPDEYGGISAVELNFKNDCVYISGELCDEAESIRDYLHLYHRKDPLYGSLLVCAGAIEGSW